MFQTERQIKRQNLRFLALVSGVAIALLLSGCAGTAEKLSRIGQPPSLSAPAATLAVDEQRPVNIPMPPQQIEVASPNSLWQASRQTFFKDQRASRVGDILTILIDIKDEADLQNRTSRSRQAGEGVGVPNFLGLESQLAKVLPESVSPSDLVRGSSSSNHTGNGSIKREEEIKLKLAAMITQVLPNGNLVIRGSQEVRVNSEMRELTIDGLIRPEDILNNNSVSYEKIAEARISYGGRGVVTDVQQPRYGQQFYDIVFPF